MEIYEMPWYNNQEIQDPPTPIEEKKSLVTRLRSKVSKKVVVATGATLGFLAATAAVTAKARSHEEDGSSDSTLETDVE